MNNFSKTFADRLSVLRKIKKLSQEDVAQALGIARQSLSLYENGERVPNIETLAEMARFFNVSADYLLGFNDSYYSESPDCMMCAEFVDSQLQEQRANFAAQLEKMARDIRERSNI